MLCYPAVCYALWYKKGVAGVAYVSASGSHEAERRTTRELMPKCRCREIKGLDQLKPAEALTWSTVTCPAGSAGNDARVGGAPATHLPAPAAHKVLGDVGPAEKRLHSCCQQVDSPGACGGPTMVNDRIGIGTAPSARRMASEPALLIAGQRIPWLFCSAFGRRFRAGALGDRSRRPVTCQATGAAAHRPPDHRE